MAKVDKDPIIAALGDGIATVDVAGSTDAMVKAIAEGKAPEVETVFDYSKAKSVEEVNGITVYNW